MAMFSSFSKRPARRGAFAAVITAAAVLVAASASFAAPGDSGAKQPEVGVAGVRIVAKPYQGNQRMRAFNWFPGTEVVLQVHYPQGNLIGLDKKASQLDAFTDDRGTDLLGGEDRFGRSGFGDTHTSEDGKAALVEIGATRVPKSGAARLHVKGTLVLRSASGKKPMDAKNVSLKPGTKVKAGPVSATIKQVGKPQWGQMAMKVTLTNQSGLGQVAGVQFLDASGHTIKSTDGGSMSSNGKLLQRSYRLAKKVKSVTIRFQVWKGLKQVKVPFDVTTAVGLGTK